jgi:ribosomal protein L7/L12
MNKSMKLGSYVATITGRALLDSEIEVLTQILDEQQQAQSRFFSAQYDVDCLLWAVRTERKLEAVKAYRQLTGVGLREAKDKIETHRSWVPLARDVVS